MDGTIPRAQLPLVLRRMQEMSAKYGLRVANVFHAGDGNLHPLILYDANKPGELERAEAFGADILRLCVEVGGVLTGEHGVGVEKRDLMPVMFSETDLNQQQRLKCAFDENGLLNPGQGLSDAAPLRRAWPHARPCRPSGVPGPAAVLTHRAHDRTSQTARRRGGRAGRQLGARRRQDAGNRRPWQQARDRPGGAMGRDARPFRALRRHALRAGRACAVGEGRHAACRDRGACWRQTARSSPSSRWTMVRCLAARPAAARSAARLRRTFPARGASRPARRATISSASARSPDAARRSNPAAGW